MSISHFFVYFLTVKLQLPHLDLNLSPFIPTYFCEKWNRNEACISLPSMKSGHRCKLKCCHDDIRRKRTKYNIGLKHLNNNLSRQLKTHEVVKPWRNSVWVPVKTSFERNCHGLLNFLLNVTRFSQGAMWLNHFYFLKRVRFN